ncbi:NRDE family protein [uncultured Lacinutrix sp.]|uniref:NRDE family protein n=1 Tax=uncultured Lacinutrix sp. TaxID=574032 RepID=UPI00260CF21D|nr:NRDE family protein [uncultured Lacinutrix sp.]
MCTVTIFYKGNNDFVLTSNRDEAPNRIANSPDFYNIDNTGVLMPKDEQSGGSWIGVSDKNRIVCLLNGGFKLHKRKTKYRKSRGVVVRDILTMKNSHDIQDYDFNDIEPFTIVIADWNDDLKFNELIWTGEKVSFKALPLTNHIWSSSTLYTEEKKQARRDWFKDFKLNNVLSSKSLLEFHKTAGKGNLDFGVVMDRDYVKTTSITQVDKVNESIEMSFHNLNTSETSVKSLNIVETLNE